MAWGGRDQRSVWRGRTRRWSILTPAVFAAALARSGRGFPPCTRQRGTTKTINQNSHGTWIKKRGLATGSSPERKSRPFKPQCRCRRGMQMKTRMLLEPSQRLWMLEFDVIVRDRKC